MTFAAPTFFCSSRVIADPRADKGLSMTTPTRALSLLLLTLPVLAAGCVAESEQDVPDGALLFELDDEDVRQIHADYLADEDLDLVRARVTAPFDCSLFGDMCTQVGRDAAIEITGQQVEQMLTGASLEEIEAYLAEAIPAASKAWRELEATLSDDEVETFRGSSDWATRTKGEYRLRVQNGLTTPLAGDRRAWTVSKLQEQDWLGIWGAVNGTEICANTGNNTQILTVSPGVEVVLEDIDPAKACLVGNNTFEQETFHARNNSGSNVYEITVRGCGSGEVNGIFLGICADNYVDAF